MGSQKNWIDMKKIVVFCFCSVLYLISASVKSIYGWLGENGRLPSRGTANARLSVRV